MKKSAIVLTALFLILLAGQTTARDPSWGGLATVALSPDGKTIATGGANRVLYILDGETLEVRERIWVASRVGQLCFSKDGSRLVLEDDEEVLHFFETKTWKVVNKVEKTGEVSFAPRSDILAGYRQGRSPSVVFLSMTDGAKLGEVVLPARLSCLGLSADGKKLAVLTEPKKEGEKIVSHKDRPKDLRGLAKVEFVQKNDGRTCTVLSFDVPSGKKTSEATLWYTTSTKRSRMAVHEGFTYVLNYSNENAKIAYDGATTLFQSANSYNYGIGISHDRTLYLSGGLRGGTRGAVDGSSTAEFELERIPGWPEYFEGFTFSSDGTGFGVTSAFRLMKLDKEGKIVKCVPVY